MEPLNSTDHATLDQVPKEAVAEAQVAAEPSDDETPAQETDRPAKGKEPENTASDINDASAKSNVPRVGFKHNPAEEAIMAHMELDVGVTQKKKKKKRPKSQRGLVRPLTTSSVQESF